jgi:hypothetical protein
LVALTKGTYLYANSMQTQQRKIPIRGSNGTFKTWAEVLVPFEKELARFKFVVDSLSLFSQEKASAKVINFLYNAQATVSNAGMQYYTVDSSAKVFADTSLYISNIATEIKNLKGLQLNYHNQIANGTEINFTNDKPIKILVGFFKPQKGAFSKDSTFLKEPELETNASANDYGQAEIKIANAVVIKGMPPVNVHSYSFPAGKNVLQLAKGACLILGIVDDKQTIPVYDAGLTEGGMKKEIDWLFE